MLDKQIKVQVDKLSLRENDILMVKCLEPIDEERMQTIGDNLKGIVNCKALFYMNDLDFSVLTNERLKELGLKRI